MAHVKGSYQAPPLEARVTAADPGAGLPGGNIVAAGLLLAILAWRAWSFLGVYAIDYDEGPQLQAAWLWLSGFSLYDEVALNKPPLLTYMLAAVLHLSDNSLFAVRGVMLAGNLIGVALLAAYCERVVGRYAGTACMLLLLSVPEMPQRCVMTTNDLPALSMLIAGLFLLADSRRSRAGALAAGVALGSAILLHPLMVLLLAGPLGVAVLPQGESSRRFLPATCAGAVIIVGFVALLSDSRAMYDWVLGFNSTAAVPDAVLAQWFPGSSWRRLGGYLAALWWIPALAAGGMVLCCSRRRSMAMMHALWFGTVFSALACWKYLWPHYHIFLLLPLFPLAAVPFARLVQLIEGRGMPWLNGICHLAVIGAGCCLAVRGPSGLPLDQFREEIMLMSSVREEFVITDDQFLAFVAGKKVPPSLADTSNKRIYSGHLTLPEIEAAFLDYRVHAVYLGTHRLRQVPGLLTFLEADGWTERRTGRGSIFLRNPES